MSFIIDPAVLNFREDLKTAFIGFQERVAESGYPNMLNDDNKLIGYILNKTVGNETVGHETVGQIRVYCQDDETETFIAGPYCSSRTKDIKKNPSLRRVERDFDIEHQVTELSRITHGRLFLIRLGEMKRLTSTHPERVHSIPQGEVDSLKNGILSEMKREQKLEREKGREKAAEQRLVEKLRNATSSRMSFSLFQIKLLSGMIQRNDSSSSSSSSSSGSTEAISSSSNLDLVAYDTDEEVDTVPVPITSTTFTQFEEQHLNVLNNITSFDDHLKKEGVNSDNFDVLNMSNTLSSAGSMSPLPPTTFKNIGGAFDYLKEPAPITTFASEPHVTTPLKEPAPVTTFASEPYVTTPLTAKKAAGEKRPRNAHVSAFNRILLDEKEEECDSETKYPPQKKQKKGDVTAASVNEDLHQSRMI